MNISQVVWKLLPRSGRLVAVDLLGWFCFDSLCDRTDVGKGEGRCSG